MSPSRRARVLAVVAVTGLTVAALGHVRARLDRGDERAATAVARGWRGPSGRTVDEALRAEFPGARVAWRADPPASPFRPVRVRAVVTTAGGATHEHAFDVDLAAPSLHPGNARGEAVLRRVGAR